MRRILLFVTDLEIGGTPTVVRELALRLNHPPDVEIEIACLAKWGPVADQIRDGGVNVTALNARGPADFIVATWKLAHLIRARQIDTVVSFLIHANTVAAAASLFRRDVRFIQSIQTTQPRPAWHWRMQSLVHHATECVIVPSPSTAEIAFERSGVPLDKVIVIPNAIDPDSFERSSVPETNTRPFPIGFIGRLDPVKRIGDLIEAVMPLSDRVRLHIFGDGPERARLQSYARQTNNVTFHGAIARPQDALAQIGLLVLPSEAEGFGLVLIEAMAAGVPVIGTNVLGIRDVIDNEKNGLLVPPASPREVGLAIDRIISDSSLRQRLIEGGLCSVRERYMWNVVLPTYRNLLRIER